MKKLFLMAGFMTAMMLNQGAIRAQTNADYFTPSNKKLEIDKLAKNILAGCTIPLVNTPPYPAVEIKDDAAKMSQLLGGQFSKSFGENPNLEKAFLKDLDAIANDTACQSVGQHCRERLVATAVYYFQRLRPNIQGCENYDPNKVRSEACELEKVYRTQTLDRLRPINGGKDGKSTYAELLKDSLNRTLELINNQILFKTVRIEYGKKGIINLKKDPINLAICETPNSGQIYQSKLFLNLFEEPVLGVNPSAAPAPKPVTAPILKKPEPPVPASPCEEEKKVLFEEFVPLNFDEGDATIRGNELKPVRDKIENFLNTHAGITVTDILISSNASRTPFHKTINGVRVIDPDSDAKNLKLAAQRSDNIGRLMQVLKSKNNMLKGTEIDTNFAIKGPAFNPSDVKLRAVTSTNGAYAKKVDELFEANKSELKEVALITSTKELLNTEKFKNLYEVKFKPYQGFRVKVSGYGIEKTKCDEAKKAGKIYEAPATTESTGSGESAPGGSQQ